MNYTRLLAAAALVGCAVLPSAAQAQYRSNNPIGGGYGIFGTGSNLAGVYTGPNTSNFGRNYNYTPSQIGNFVQSAYTGSNVQPLGLYGLGANGAGGNSSILSPYLNLLRPGNAAINYYGGVRAVRENQANGDWATNFKQAERIGEEELRAQQGLENPLTNVDWSQGYKQAEYEGEKEARRRAGENPEPEFRDWATSYKDQEIQGEAKAEKDRMKSKQRAANLRQAKELKELEAELAASGPAEQGKVIAPPSLAAGLQTYHGPGYASQFRSMTHFYPSQGLPVGRIGGH